MLAFETSTDASIMKPIALQLINQHYSVSESGIDDDTAGESDESDIAILEKDLKRTIHKILQQKYRFFHNLFCVPYTFIIKFNFNFNSICSIIENRFLTMASFLDPRFQRLTPADDLKWIYDDIAKDVQNDEAKSTEKSEEKPSKSKMDNNFGLSSLFPNVTQVLQTKAPRNRFDIEFRSYTQDVSLDMEMCPLEWWSENDSLYPNIKQYVKKYFCVPSFVNNLHRQPLHEEELARKYDRFADEINDKLLWLHLVDLRQKLLDS